MPARSLVIQLQPGIQQAILPDHRKMLPGIQYVVDWETFDKLSLGARQNIISVVSVNTDTVTTSGSYVVAQTSSPVNSSINIANILSQTSTSATGYTLGGFAAQGYSAGGEAGTNVGVQALGGAGEAINVDLEGPAGERYQWVYNNGAVISGTQVVVWSDENNRFVTNARPTYQVFADAQGTDYVASVNDTTTSPTTIGTKQGRFAGVALVNVPSGSYGWIQIEGFCPAVQVSGAVTAGATIGVVPNQSAGYIAPSSATVGANNLVTGGPLASNVFGTALTANSSGVGTVSADIRSTRPKKPYTRFLNKN
jgi:hypothetical protein